MSAPGTPTPRAGVPAQMIAGLVAVAGLCVLTALPTSGALGVLRAVLGCLLIVVVPGWLLARVADRGGWLPRLFAGVALSAAFYAILGFVLVKLSVHWTTAAVVIPAAIAGAILSVVPGAPTRWQRQAGSVAFAAALCAAAVGAAIVTHEVLPAAPAEAAFSLAADGANVSASSVSVSVTIERVGTTRPATLSLVLDGHVARTVVVADPGTADSSPEVVDLSATAPVSAPFTCATTVRVTATNGAFVSPPVTCTAASP